MRFKIYGNKEQLPKIFEEMQVFARLCKEEFDKDWRIKLASKTMKKLTVTDVMFLAIAEKKKDHVLLTVKATMWEKGRLRMARNMSKNIEGYLKAKEVEYEKVEGFNV